MSMENEVGLGLAVHWVQQDLISVYEDICSLRPVRKGKNSLRWTSELESLRREVRQLFNRCQAGNSLHSWELNREAQQSYKKEVRKVSKEIWRSYCSSIKDLPRSARLNRAVSREPKSVWDLWWLLLESIRNQKGKLWISCLPLTSPTQFFR